MPSVNKAFDSDVEEMPSRPQRGQTDAETYVGVSANDKEINTQENNVAKIKVVVCCTLSLRTDL